MDVQNTDAMQPATLNPLLAQLTHRPFPEVAEILRAGAGQITVKWDVAVRQAMPQMQRLTFDELKDSTPNILLAIADALASDDPDLIRELVSRAPAQGLSRLKLNFDVVEVMQEDRLLRAITVQHVEEGLWRQMDAAESAALHAAIDIMLQRSVIALVDEQKSQLRWAAETELKFLSFLSHDLNNNLNSITNELQLLGLDLKDAGGFTEAEESLGRAQQYIYSTVAGMRRILELERLRKSGTAGTLSPVDLHALATKVSRQYSREAHAKRTRLIVELSPATMIESDSDLLSLVLQNLVGNAVKYSTAGAVRVGFIGDCEGDCKTDCKADCKADSNGHSNGDSKLRRSVLWVSDEGPGIAPAQLQLIFEAFRRGDVHGQHGVGLGLAIASQAAKLLGADLTVESEVGAGSTFRLALAENCPTSFKVSRRPKMLVRKDAHGIRSGHCAGTADGGEHVVRNKGNPA